MNPAEDLAERDRRARERAYEEGRRDQEVDGRLNSHEARLRAINGSIERNVHEAKNLRKSIESLQDQIERIAATLATQEAVDRTRNEQLKQANEKQISNRTFWLGVVTIVVMIAIAIITSHGSTFG